MLCNRDFDPVAVLRKKGAHKDNAAKLLLGTCEIGLEAMESLDGQNRPGIWTFRKCAKHRRFLSDSIVNGVNSVILGPSPIRYKFC